MATTRLMPLHTGKGRNVSTAIATVIDYVENPQKTDYGRLISGYGCDTRTADVEFLLSKRQYQQLTGRQRGADDVIAYGGMICLHRYGHFWKNTICPERPSFRFSHTTEAQTEPTA